jgi:hypothetical protein
MVMFALVACHRRSDVSLPSPAAIDASALPARIAGFTAGPLDRDAIATRRTYARGATRIAVTLARFEMSADQYRDWVRTSVASFPQAVLDLPAADGNGFYQCTEGDAPSCDLLIQLRSGFHLEIRGGGTSRREDVDAIAHGLALAALAAPSVNMR